MAIVRPDQSSGGGGGGTVKSVKATDTSIVVAGTATDPTIATGTLDVIAADHPPAADWSNNAHKITGLANGSAATDAAAFGQIPATLGLTQLIYRYTVTGSAKASIDTGVDTPNAGSNDWTNGDVLEVWILGRTDEAVFASNVLVTLNNDTTGAYDRAIVGASGSGSPAQAAVTGQTAWTVGGLPGSSATANSPGVVRFTMPGYAGTSFWKVFETTFGNAQDATSGHYQCDVEVLTYRSTAAVSRLKVTPATAGKNLVIGSELLIYKRLAS